MTNFSDTTIIKRKDKDILIADLGNGVVMMDLETGKYINLNNIGKVIWEKIEHPVSVSDLINHLLSKYNVSESQCEEETFEFLERLQSQNLLI